MAEAKSPCAGPSAGICTECGLCCTGILFDDVMVEPDETGRLTRAGLPLVQGTPGDDGVAKTYFTHPCPMLTGRVCGIYADRPAVCAAYRCQVLVDYEDGSLTRDEALDRIAAARGMMEVVAALMPEDETLPAARARWRGNMVAARTGQTGDAADKEFMLRMSLLNIYLDRHFYRDTQGQMMSAEE